MLDDKVLSYKVGVEALKTALERIKQDLRNLLEKYPEDFRIEFAKDGSGYSDYYKLLPVDYFLYINDFCVCVFHFEQLDFIRVYIDDGFGEKRVLIIDSASTHHIAVQTIVRTYLETAEIDYNILDVLKRDILSIQSGVDGYIAELTDKGITVFVESPARYEKWSILFHNSSVSNLKQVTDCLPVSEDVFCWKTNDSDENVLELRGYADLSVFLDSFLSKEKD